MPSWAGGWDGLIAASNAAPHSLLSAPQNLPTSRAYGATERNVARQSAPQGGTKFGEIAAALAAGGPGGATVYSYKQVSARQADGMNMGGLVPISEYFVVPARTLTIADREYVQDQFRPTWAPNPYPVEKSGNSGGGMVGTVNK